MGGLYIDCGSFTGSDNKWGRSILHVLEGLRASASEDARAVLSRLMRDIEAWLWSPPVEFRIAPHDAEILLPGIYEYRRQLEGVLPTTDESELFSVYSDETANGIDLKGPAHQYLCLRDVERAFETAIAEHQPVVLTWD